MTGLQTYTGACRERGSTPGLSGGCPCSAESIFRRKKITLFLKDIGSWVISRGHLPLGFPSDGTDVHDAGDEIRRPELLGTKAGVHFHVPSVFWPHARHALPGFPWPAHCRALARLRRVPPVDAWKTRLSKTQWKFLGFPTSPGVIGRGAVQCGPTWRGSGVSCTFRRRLEPRWTGSRKPERSARRRRAAAHISLGALFLLHHKRRCRAQTVLLPTWDRKAFRLLSHSQWFSTAALVCPEIMSSVLCKIVQFHLTGLKI